MAAESIGSRRPWIWVSRLRLEALRSRSTAKYDVIYGLESVRYRSCFPSLLYAALCAFGYQSPEPANARRCKRAS